MATREEVYIEYGRAAEVAQLLETEIGTALLALDALETKSFVNPDADTYKRLRDAIDGQTLGASLKQMGKYLDLKNDTGGLLSRALETRNLLTHRFYRQHGFAILEDAGRAKMAKHLREIHAQLSEAYAIAGYLSQTLVSSVMLLKKVHGKQ